MEKVPQILTERHIRLAARAKERLAHLRPSVWLDKMKDLVAYQKCFRVDIAIGKIQGNVPESQRGISGDLACQSPNGDKVQIFRAGGLGVDYVRINPETGLLNRFKLNATHNSWGNIVDFSASLEVVVDPANSARNPLRRFSSATPATENGLQFGEVSKILDAAALSARAAFRG